MSKLNNTSVNNVVDDKLLEQIINDAKPFLKKSLQQWIIEQSTKKYFGDDLFQLSFDEFINLSAHEQRNWRHQILKEKKEWLSKQLVAKKAQWLLIVGGKVELASPSLDDLPKKQKIYGLAKSKGFAPFMFIKDPLIDEFKNEKNTQILQ